MKFKQANKTQDKKANKLKKHLQKRMFSRCFAPATLVFWQNTTKLVKKRWKKSGKKVKKKWKIVKK